MTDVSNLGSAIRAPFNFIGDVLNLIMKNFLPISIIAGSIYFLYWIFSKGIMKRLVDEIVKRKKEKEGVNATNYTAQLLKGGVGNGI